MGCLKGGVVANVVVPTPAYVRFATHYCFRPDFCEGCDLNRKGSWSASWVTPSTTWLCPRAWTTPTWPEANEAAQAWCAEVNAQVHAETCSVPDQRLEAERPLLGALPSLRPSFGRAVARKVDRLSCVRFGSARYSVPTKLIGRSVEVVVSANEVQVMHFGEIMATHELVAPGGASVKDEHYGGARRAPERRPRPRSSAEKAICALGEVGEAFIEAAAGAGVTKLSTELADIAALEAAHGTEALVGALARALEFRRFRAGDVRSILAAGKGTARPSGPGQALVVDLPKVRQRPLSEYASAGGAS